MTENEQNLAEKVGKREQKRLGRPEHRILSYFGLFGLVGFTIAIPSVAGALIGKYLDENYPGKASWSLTFLLAGLAVGCYNAWRYIKKEYRE